MIELREITLKSGSLAVLDNLSLTLPDPGIYLISGPSAGGKTTLCRLISGRLKPQSGQVLIDGSRPRNHLSAMSGEFYSEGGLADTFNESARDYLAAELAAAGTSFRSAADYIELLDAFLPQGISRPLNIMSSGEQLLLQVVLAAAAPGRVAVLDGHLNRLSGSAATFCWQLLQRSLTDHEKYIILTSLGEVEFNAAEYTHLKLTGDLPVTLAD